jgi:hypothetical protein
MHDVTCIHVIHLSNDRRFSVGSEHNDHGGLTSFDNVYMRWRVLARWAVNLDLEFAITNDGRHRTVIQALG